ncbi:CaiB/BaiF CoA transferase family protein [Methylovirgula sp. 4M-Z18]|uniref:CaiB/BaiF CoA transferase family protein n=1 Tax=Methylovirgula sp. 4M-Z18 TaxID=2293567 RepID=UPI000E2F2B46|nr:CaiB/BaiF CoA-transferase family protein [Methylovirgula sp. 4M-Z18]RFB78128.1 CoA transferase [Methylovirgula sp. 4M-Z18]
MQAPLSGIKVLELARILAGPWVGQLLADLGADVVKVERAGAGDDTRHWGPPFVEGVDGENLGAAYYHSCNRGKRCITADFETPEGQELVRKLAAHADVVIENFKVGGLKKYGLDYASLSAINPRLVYCSITGFGQDGPYAPRAGYDFLVQGMGGVMDLTGQPDGPPSKTGVAIADIFTGLYAANGIQAALLRRERTGEGAYIDCALLDAQVAVLGYQALNYMVSGKEPRRMGNGHPNIVPYDVFPVADGHIIIATGNDGQYRKLCEILGDSALGLDPNFALSKDRVINRVALTEKLQALTRRFTRADLLPRLDAAAVPAGPINGVKDVLKDPQVIARGMQLSLANPNAKSGATPGLRSAIVMDGQGMASDRPAPALGEHTDEILSDPAWGALSAKA